ncbi:tetratricopeptide repeat protein [Leptospira interrogans serovar Szwajizak]|uniref:tetratricopeptide repeat protein n=1 Tax=Leptospira interrogans TaxID=173 RepID=UPI00034CD28F|nr:tetratricopeptide repeat protein [Leptospira interrogans]
MINRVLGLFLIIGILIFVLSFFSTSGQSEDQHQSEGPSRIQSVVILIREFLWGKASHSNLVTSVTTAENPQEIFKRAYRANEKKAYLNAVEEYSKYLKLVPNDASAYYNRGLVHYTLKRYNDAVRDFEKAVEIDPSKTYAFLYKGYAYEMISDCKQAIEDFEKAISLGENKNAELYGHKARCENRSKNYDEGFQDALKALNIDKKNAYAFFELAYAQYGLKKYSDSVESYTKVLQFSPNDGVAFHNRGLALVFLNKIPSACKDFQRSSEIGYFDSKKKLDEYCK